MHVQIQRAAGSPLATINSEAGFVIVTIGALAMALTPKEADKLGQVLEAAAACSAQMLIAPRELNAPIVERVSL
jgi:hypothetical protein